MHRHKSLLSATVTSALWLALLSGYLRAEALEPQSMPPETQEDDQLVIVAVGDIMMGSVHPANKLPPEDGKGIFDAVLENLKAGDIIFGNLEGPLIDQGVPEKCTKKLPQCYEFITPTRYADHLKEAGFNVVNIANNHTFDCGVSGVKSTVNTLRAVGIEPTGGATVARMLKKGRRVAVVAFSFTLSDYAYSMLDVETAERIVKELKQENDIVIVSFHGGNEGRSAMHTVDTSEKFLGEHRGNVVKFSRSVIDAGADLVLGHGPHVLRAMEVHKGKLIVYSLGNFLTYKMFNVKGVNGLSIILTLRINPSSGDFIGGKALSIKLTKDGIPEIDPRGQGAVLLNRLTVEDIKNGELVVDERSGSLFPARR